MGKNINDIAAGDVLIAVTESDATVYSPPLRALWVGGAGDLSIVADGDSSPVTIAGVAAGTLIDWVLIKQVRVATTATNMVGTR